MGVLANHVPSIEQLKPGVVEVVEESGGAKQWFRTSNLVPAGQLCQFSAQDPWENMGKR